MPMRRIIFTVWGKPQPAGSKIANRYGGVRDANKNAAPYKQHVATVAAEAMSDQPLFTGPLRVEMSFYRVRPQSHFGKTGMTKQGRETPSPVAKPDVLKLARACEDAMTGVVYRDDAQIVEEYLVKAWGEKEAVVISIEGMT